MSLPKKQLQRRAGLMPATPPSTPRDRSSLPKARQAWVYKRLSTHEQRKKSVWGLAMQDELERLPAEDGYPVEMSPEEAAGTRSARDYPGWYVNGRIHVEERDLGISGTKNHTERPGLAALIAAIDRGEVEAVYVLDIKRLYRDQYLIDAMTFAKLCKDRNVLIVTPVLTYDLSQEIYYEMYQIEVRNAAQELKVLRFRLGGAKDLKAKRGFWDGRPVCWGYIVDLDPESPTYQKYVVYSPHQKILIELFKLAACNRSYRKLVQDVRRVGLSFPPFPPELHEQQFLRHAMHMCKLDPDGGYTPTLHSIDSILTNPTPIGWWSAGDIVIKNNHEAVLPIELFWAVQDIYNPLDYRTGQPNPNHLNRQLAGRHASSGPLAGKLYCGMHVNDGLQSQHRIQAKGQYERKDHTARYYGCTSDYDNAIADKKCLLVSQDPIDQAVTSNVLSSLSSYDLAAEVADAVEAKVREKAQRNKDVANQERLLKQEIKGLKKKLPWVRSRRDYNLLMEEIDTRQSRIEALKGVAKRSPNVPIKPDQVEDVRAFLDLISKHWNRVSLEARTRFLDILLDRVTVYHDSSLRLELHVQWRTGVVDILEVLRPLPPRPASWRWEPWEDDALRRFYASEPDPRNILAQLKSCRNWTSAMERAWKLGLKRPKDLTPWGIGRNSVAPLRERKDMNPTGLKPGEYRHVGTIWEGEYHSPKGGDNAQILTSWLQTSPAIRQTEGNKAKLSSNDLSGAALRSCASPWKIR